MKLEAICQQIKLVLSDVDGVLTDGGIVLDNQGIEAKKFHVRDGLGIRLWRRAGFRFGVVTARNSQIVKMRCGELDVDIVRQGVQEKLPAVQAIVRDAQLTMEQVCYVGDDLTDLPVIRYVGLGVAVADAAAEVREAAQYVTRLAGGQGAVRELIELLLKHQQRWDELIRRYTT